MGSPTLSNLNFTKLYQISLLPLSCLSPTNNKAMKDQKTFLKKEKKRTGIAGINHNKQVTL